ncbi:hypothetical protein BC826DRAFT_1046071 [Russula brevipes]|nr:hypothetical protein BC826DRAFT_1046071 [Russula brevipes]
MSSNSSSSEDVFLYFIAIFIPPLAVVAKRGCGAEVCVNICLWIIGWIPGVIHAWWIISKGPRTTTTSGTTGVTTAYVTTAPPPGTSYPGATGAPPGTTGAPPGTPGAPPVPPYGPGTPGVTPTPTASVPPSGTA